MSRGAEDCRPRVILMGVTGSGKSTFISNIVGLDIGIGHGSEPQTTEHKEVEVEMEGNRRVFLVDTPGFGSTTSTDRDQLRKTSEWLMKRGVSGGAIAGVVYLQMVNERITLDSATIVKNLDTFKKLYDTHYVPQIRIITTHWHENKQPQDLHNESQYKQSQDLHNKFMARLKDQVDPGVRIGQLECNHGDQPFPRNTINSKDAKSILYGMFKPRIILLGRTGSGKSTFISTVLGKDIGIGHDLVSCTKEIQEFPIQYRGREIVLIDTPGFDDTDSKAADDENILKKIGDWMKKKGIRSETLRGVVYLHNLSEIRPTNAPKQHLQRLKVICGEGYSPRICLATTFASAAVTVQQSHNHFKEQFWKELVQDNTQIFEIKDKTGRYPIQILDYILDIKESASPDVCLQFKIAKEHILEGEIRNRVTQLEGERTRLEQALKNKPHDNECRERLDGLKSRIRLGEAQMARLRQDAPGSLPCSILPF